MRISIFFIAVVFLSLSSGALAQSVRSTDPDLHHPSNPFVNYDRGYDIYLIDYAAHPYKYMQYNPIGTSNYLLLNGTNPEVEKIYFFNQNQSPLNFPKKNYKYDIFSHGYLPELRQSPPLLIRG